MNKKRAKLWKRMIAFLCAISMCMGSMAVDGLVAKAEGNPDRTDIASYAPEGYKEEEYENIAIGKTVTTSSTYELDGWGAGNSYRWNFGI